MEITITRVDHLVGGSAFTVHRRRSDGVTDAVSCIKTTDGWCVLGESGPTAFFSRKEDLMRSLVA